MKKYIIYILILILIYTLNSFSQPDSVITFYKCHTGPILSVAISQDGNKIVTSSTDSTVRIWNANTGIYIGQLDLYGNPGIVQCVAFSEDGSKIVTGSSDQPMKLWDANTGVLIRDFLWNGVNCVAISSDGNWIACGRGGWMEVWDANTGENLHTEYAHFPKVTSIAISKDGKRIVTGGGRDYTANVWGWEKGFTLSILEGHNGDVKGVAINKDGSKVITCSYDGTVKIWDVNSKKVLRTLNGNLFLNSVSLSNDENIIISGSSSENKAKIWDANTGELIRTITDSIEYSYFNNIYSFINVAINKDASKIATGLKIWNPNNGIEICRLSGHGNSITSIAICKDGSKLVTGSEDGTAKIWDANTGKEIRTIEQIGIIDPTVGNIETITSVAISPDGNLVVTASRNGHSDYAEGAKVWDANTGKFKFILEFIDVVVTNVAFSSDGSKILTSSKSNIFNPTHIIWDANTGLEIKRFHDAKIALMPDGNKIVRAKDFIVIEDFITGKELISTSLSPFFAYFLVVSQDGSKIVIVDNDYNIKIFDASTLKLLNTFTTDSIKSIAVNKDGSRVAIGYNNLNITRIWDTNSGQIIRTYYPNYNNSSVNSVVFSYDDLSVIIGSSDCSARRLFIDLYKQRNFIFLGHSDKINCVSLSKNNSILITGSSDNTAKLWNANTGSLIKTCIGHSDKINSVSFYNNYTFITGSKDKTAKI